MSISPPLQPSFCSVSQSTSSCSDNETNLFVFKKFIPSTAATVENAQQLPAIININRGNGTFLPPVNRWSNILYIFIHKGGITKSLASEHAMMTNLGSSIEASELLVSHVCKLVQLQLVRLIQLVGVVNMFNIGLENIESLALVLKTPRQSVVAPPPLVHTPQPFFGLQLLVMILETLAKAKNQSQREEENKNKPLCFHTDIFSFCYKMRKLQRTRPL